MAKKQAVKKAGKAAGKATGKKKKGGGFRLHLTLIFLLVISGVFLSSAVILYIGLIPTFVAFFVDRSPRKMRALTVGSFNLMGCMPFLMQLWTTDVSIKAGMEIIFDPMALVIIYSAAGLGYIVDWWISSTVASFLYKQGVARQAAIKARQAELIERWGHEVTGQIAPPPAEDAQKKG